MEENAMKQENMNKGISGSTLKLIALFTMLIDHVGAVVLEKGYLPYLYDTYGVNSAIVNQWETINTLMRCVGRMAFPIFCFLLVEGYAHTRNVKKYLGRLLLFAFVSELPFNYALEQMWFDARYQNVFFTLFLGLAAVASYDAVCKKSGKDSYLATLLVVFFFGAIAVVLRTDYNFTGVCLIFFFYLFRESEFQRNLYCAIMMLGAGMIEIAGYVAFVPMHFYNGKRGMRLKYIFYLFYPVHFLVLAWVRACLLG